MEVAEKFKEWVSRAMKLAAQLVVADRKRAELVSKVRDLRAKGEREAVDSLQPDFERVKKEKKAVHKGIDAFRQEFEKSFGRDEQLGFIYGMEKRAVANQFTFRAGTEMLNVASQVMYVIAPRKRDVFAFLRLRDRTGLNVTEKDVRGVKRLIGASEKLLTDLASQLTPIEDVAEGVVTDFGGQEIQDEYDDLASDVGALKGLLARFEEGAARRSEEGGRRGHEREQQEPPEPTEIERLEEEIAAKNAVIGNLMRTGKADDMINAGNFMKEVEGLQNRVRELRDEKAKKARASGAASMQGAPAPGETGEPMGGPVVTGDPDAAKAKAGDNAAKIEALKAEIERLKTERSTHEKAAEGHDAEVTRAQEAIKEAVAASKFEDLAKLNSDMLKAQAAATGAMKFAEDASDKAEEMEAEIKRLEAEGKQEKPKKVKAAKAKPAGQTVGTSPEPVETPAGASADNGGAVVASEDPVIVKVRADLKASIAAGDEKAEEKAYRRLKALGAAV